MTSNLAVFFPRKLQTRRLEHHPYSTGRNKPDVYKILRNGFHVGAHGEMNRGRYREGRGKCRAGAQRACFSLRQPE